MAADLTGQSEIETALTYVGEILDADGEAFAIVILGGAALNLLGVVARSTTDVDILAIARPRDTAIRREISEPPIPLPESLSRAIRLVADDMGLAPDWMNTGPALQWRTGLPPGLAGRIHWRRYGNALDVGIVSRFDLIFFKLFAAADDIGTAAFTIRISSRSRRRPMNWRRPRPGYAARTHPSNLQKFSNRSSLMSADTSASANALLTELSSTLRDAVTHVLWLQWRALGAQTATRGRAQSLVDPEALVLASLTLSAAEPRLRDVLADWTTLNASLLSVQRLKNLIAESAVDLQPLVAEFARFVLTEARDVRWRSLATDAVSAPEFSRRTNKLRAREAAFDDAAALWLRLRLALSVGIKADTMAFLLGSAGAWASGRVIAGATSYTLPAVRRAVDDLSQAGLVLQRKQPQKTAVEYSVRHQPWAEALGLDRAVPVWQNWRERFAFAAAFLAWTERTDGKTVSRYAFGALGRDLLAKHASVLDDESTGTTRAKRETQDWPAAVERTVRHFARRLVRDA